ncbi:MAG: NADH-quinone oxidoreductase subunit A [bacterium]
MQELAGEARLWPLGVYFGFILLLVSAMLALAYLLGERREGRATRDPFESGIAPTGSARMRFDAKFYLMAMFFVIFDVEAAFVLSWAVAARELGWQGYAEVVVFIGLLAAALAYLWRLGALDWGTLRQRSRGRRLR